MYREQCSSVWTKLAWVSGLPKGLGERGFYTGEWGGGEEKGSWMLRSALIFGGNTGWNSIVRYVAWCMHWLKRRSISCVTDSWSLGGKLAETLLTPSWHTGKTCDRISSPCLTLFRIPVVDTERFFLGGTIMGTISRTALSGCFLLSLLLIHVASRPHVNSNAAAVKTDAPIIGSLV